MDFLKPKEFTQLKGFFLALKNGQFKVNSDINIATVRIDGIPTPINKTECLKLLRSFPDLQGENFKDDNFLIKYLLNPVNREHISGRLTQEQQIELTKVLERPIEAEFANEQSAGSATGQQPLGEPASTMTGGGPSFPGIGTGVSAAPTARRVVRIAQQTKPPGASQTVPGLNNTPETGLDYEGKPYEMDTDYKPQTAKETAPAKSVQRTTETSQVRNYPKPPVIETGLDAEGKPFEEDARYPKSSPTKSATGGNSSRKFQAPKIPMGAAKNLGSRAGVFFERNIGKYLTAGRLATVATTGIGAFVGAGFGGAGALAGGVAGAITPSFIRSGGAGRFLGKVGNGAVNSFSNFSNQVAGKRPSLGLKKGLGTGKKVALAGALFLMLFLGSLAASIGGGLGQNPTTGQAAPITSGGDLSSCLFTRADQSPANASFKSPQLLGYFQEASAKSGVPATVLAGIARIESPGIVNQTDATLSSYTCATSETGARGLMQVQPPGTTGNSSSGVALGAQFLGIPVDQLNFCDIRQNIYLGAGVISTKVGGSWDPTKTNDKSYIDKVAAGYYGCLRYGGPPGTACSDPRRIYSYGDDLYAGVSSCKPATNNSSTASNPAGLTGIVNTAAQITPLLYKPNPSANCGSCEDVLFSKKRDEPNVPIYWCTFLIVDSYNAAGFTGLSRNADGTVLTMKSFFANTSGYRLLPPSTPVGQLRPGDVIFFEGSGDQHVSLIQSIIPDPSGNGNGVIKTYESNNVVTEDNVFFTNNQVTSAQTTSRLYSVTGFGQVTQQ